MLGVGASARRARARAYRSSFFRCGDAGGRNGRIARVVSRVRTAGTRDA